MRRNGSVACSVAGWVGLPRSIFTGLLVLSEVLGISASSWAAQAGGPPKTPAQPAPQGGKVPVLALEQRALGLPGEEPNRPLEEKMLVDTSRNRVILLIYKPEPPAAGPGSGGGGAAPTARREVDRRIVLRMDYNPPEIYEISDRDRTYRKTQKDLNHIQDERDEIEETTLRHLKDISPAEQKSTLEEGFLRRDGKRIVTVERGERKKILGHDCEEVKVLENGRMVVHAWLTREVAGARSFFQLYRRLGAFSREVLERVAGLEGLPLEAEITVVTGAPAYRISAQCVSVKNEEAAEADFDPPPGYQERKDDLPAVVKCAWCEKPVERAEASTHYLDRTTGVTSYFDTRDCYVKWKKKHEEELKRESRKSAEGAPAGSPAPAPPARN
jgi:hypothetical protein